jgi:uncharacterized protein YcbX
MILSAIHIYPIKSTAGLDLQSASIEPRGFLDDRRWIVVDADDRFLTGRQLARMVLIRTTPEDDGLRLDAPAMPTLRVARPAPDAERASVQVWDDNVDAARADAAADAWLSEFLGRPVRLVAMDARSARATEQRPGVDPCEVGFADAYPFLAISQASLDHLNAKLAAPIQMRRFRPNLVISGCEPHAEDGWRRIRIGGIDFDVVKTCTRCVFTTVDPECGERDPSGEPLRTLKTYRRAEDGIIFGVNLIARGRGELRVGDRVEVESAA